MVGMVKLEERAENHNYEDLKELKVENRVITNLVRDYISSQTTYPIFLLGPRGSGKTFNIMKALSKELNENKDFIPVVFTYQPGGPSEVLEPLKLASKDVWGERYSILQSCRTDEDFMNNSTLVVYDDIHYRFGDVLKGREDPSNLSNQLSKVLKQAKNGKKVILISEDPLIAYIEELYRQGFDQEILNQFDEISLQLGQYPRTQNTTYEELQKFRQKMNYIAFWEVPPLGPKDIRNILEDYNIKIDEQTAHFLHFFSSNPRFYLKLAKAIGKNEISMKDVKEATTQILKQKLQKRKYELNLNLSLLKLPWVLSRYYNLPSNRGNYNTVINRLGERGFLKHYMGLDSYYAEAILRTPFEIAFSDFYERPILTTSDQQPIDFKV
jgi:GTPase SAR1 family protein